LIENVGTELDGSYTIGAIRPGDYQLLVLGARSWTHRWYPASNVRSTAGTVSISADTVTSGIDVTVVDGFGISGRVFASPAGVGAAATVEVVDAVTGEIFYRTTTDPDGNYHAGPLPSGNVKVRFFDPNQILNEQWYSGSTSFATATPVSLAGGDVSAINASLAFQP